MKILAFVLASMTCLVTSDRTSQIIYYDITANGMCFRRLNATNQIGCASARGGNVGVLHYIESKEDIDWLVDKGPHKPYIVLVTPQMFNREVVDRLRTSEKINGLMVISTKNDTQKFVDDITSTFSPDLKCPNEFQSMYVDDPTYGHCKNTTWQPEASQLMFENFEFPIAILTNGTEVDFLINECYEAFNKPGPGGVAKTYPLCSAQMKAAMDAAVDTPTCIRRSSIVNNLNPQVFCDPLGSYNVYSFLHPISSNETLEEKSVIMVAARLDAMSMFDGHYPGVETTLTGLVTVLAAAEALGKVKDQIPAKTSKPIMFALFNGEAFDYIGSGRMAYDMTNGKFPKELEEGAVGPHPVNLTHLGGLIEVSQVGLPEGGSLYLHTDPLSQKTPDVKTTVEGLADAMKASGTDSGVDISSTPEVQPLPPASIQSFLKKMGLPGIVLADHSSKFSNRFYNSIYDIKSLINMTYEGVPKKEQYDHITLAAEHIAKVASAVAKTVYRLATNKTDTSQVNASNTTVTNLLYCFAQSSACELFNYTLEEANSKKIAPGNPPFSLYVSVKQPGSTQVDFRTHVAKNLLANYLGDPVKLNKTMCTNDQQKDPVSNYLFVNGAVNTSSPDQSRVGLCLKSTAAISEAKSPAFDIPDYDWSSNEYSAWSESRWENNAFMVRAFLVPSRTQEVATLCGGLAFLILSFIVIYMMDKKARVIFETVSTVADTE